jgi:GTP-binding protein
MNAEFLVSAARPEHFPPEAQPEVAFLGRSNVGKSTLINRLTGVPGLAYTSATPGRTRGLNFYRIDSKIRFVDLPGYGYARVSKQQIDQWKQLIEVYLRGRNTLKLSILLVDGRRGWMEKDLELKRWLEFHRRHYLVVATKVDKLNRSEYRRQMAAIRDRSPDERAVAFSAVTGEGMREIWQTIWTSTMSR